MAEVEREVCFIFNIYGPTYCFYCVLVLLWLNGETTASQLLPRVFFCLCKLCMPDFFMHYRVKDAVCSSICALFIFHFVKTLQRYRFPSEAG